MGGSNSAERKIRIETVTDFDGLAVVRIAVRGPKSRCQVRSVERGLLMACERVRDLWMAATPPNEQRLGRVCERLIGETSDRLFGWSDDLDLGGHVTIETSRDLDRFPFELMPAFRGRSLTRQLRDRRARTAGNPSAGSDSALARRLTNPSAPVSRVDGHGTVEQGDPAASWIEVQGERVSADSILGQSATISQSAILGHSDGRRARLAPGSFAAERGVVLNTCFGAGDDAAVGPVLLTVGYAWVVAAAGPVPTDEPVARLLRDLEDRLDSGLDPSLALLGARERAVARGHRRAEGVFSLYRAHPAMPARPSQLARPSAGCRSMGFEAA